MVAALGTGVRSASLAVCAASAASLATYCGTLGQLCGGRSDAAKEVGSEPCTEPPGTGNGMSTAFSASADGGRTLSRATWLRLLQGKKLLSSFPAAADL